MKDIKLLACVVLILIGLFLPVILIMYKEWLMPQGLFLPDGLVVSRSLAILALSFNCLHLGTWIIKK